MLVVAFIVLTILGKKAQKRKEEQDEQIAAASQTVNMLIIDKKRMKLKDAGLPQQIIEQTPKLMRRSKLPVVKARSDQESCLLSQTSKSLMRFL